MDLVRDGSIRAPNPLHIYDVDSVEDGATMVEMTECLKHSLFLSV